MQACNSHREKHLHICKQAFSGEASCKIGVMKIMQGCKMNKVHSEEMLNLCKKIILYDKMERIYVASI